MGEVRKSKQALGRAALLAGALGAVALAVAMAVVVRDGGGERAGPAAPVSRPPSPAASVALSAPRDDTVEERVFRPAPSAREEPAPTAALEAPGETAGAAAPPEAVEPAWRRFAVAAPLPAGPSPVIALVIDDMGVARAWSRQAIELPGPLTLAFMPYAPDLAGQTRAAREAGHELLVHLPMEPDDDAEDPGPNALTTGLGEAELRRRLEWGLDRFEGYVGVNNHMGSRFTRDEAAMRVVLAEVASRGLLFLDSRTVAESVAWRLAMDAGIPAARRDVFIDNEPDGETIAAQLAALEARAREQGYAVGIGHPRPETLRVLAAWLPGLAERGFTLAPISAIVGRAANE